MSVFLLFISTRFNLTGSYWAIGMHGLKTGIDEYNGHHLVNCSNIMLLVKMRECGVCFLHKPTLNYRIFNYYTYPLGSGYHFN